MKRKILFCVVGFILFDCGSDGSTIIVESQPETEFQQPVEPAPKVDVAIADGTLQCQEGGLPIETTKGYLLEMGIEVTSESCGVDYSPVLALCGLPTNKIHIFTIDESDLIEAENVGFVATTSFTHGFEIVDCVKS